MIDRGTARVAHGLPGAGHAGGDPIGDAVGVELGHAVFEARARRAHVRQVARGVVRQLAPVAEQRDDLRRELPLDLRDQVGVQAELHQEGRLLAHGELGVGDVVRPPTERARDLGPQ